MNHEKSKTYTLRSAAITLGCSLSTIRRAIEKGEIASIKVGRRRLIPESSITSLLNPDQKPEPLAPSERSRISLHDASGLFVRSFGSLKIARDALTSVHGGGVLRYSETFEVTVKVQS